LLQVLGNRFRNAFVGFARLIRIFDLKVAVVSGQSIESTPASFLGIVLLTDNPA
jgi:hypothetical protein